MSRVKKGTRMLRWRTLRREGNFDGQPWNVITDPDVPSQPPKEHFCSECFRPRSTTGTLFCYRCEAALFGLEGYGYRSFLRSEAARKVALSRSKPIRRRRAGDEPCPPAANGYRMHYWDGTLFYGRHKYPCGRMSGVINSDIPHDFDPWNYSHMGGTALMGTGRLETTKRELVTCQQCLARMEERDASS